MGKPEPLCVRCKGTGWYSTPPVQCTDGRKRCTAIKCWCQNRDYKRELIDRAIGLFERALPCISPHSNAELYERMVAWKKEAWTSIEEGTIDD